MPNNAISVGGVPVLSKDRGSNAQAQQFMDAPALSATVIVAALTTTSTSPAVPADLLTRRQIVIVNSGSVAAEISPVSGFTFGQGFPLPVGAAFTTNYNGAIYARVSVGTGELRAWSED